MAYKPKVLTVPDGGTGDNTFTAYSVVIAGTTATGNFQNVSGVGTVGQVLVSAGASALPTWSTIPYAHFRDQKTAGTSGGSFASGAWNTHTINTSVTNNITGCSLATNQITLPAGTYRIQAYFTGWSVNRYQGKLKDITNTADIIIGTSEVSQTGETLPQTKTFINGQFTAAGTAAYEIQAQCQTTDANGYGLASNFGVVEIYLSCEIWRLA